MSSYYYVSSSAHAGGVDDRFPHTTTTCVLRCGSRWRGRSVSIQQTTPPSFLRPARRARLCETARRFARGTQCPCVTSARYSVCVLDYLLRCSVCVLYYARGTQFTCAAICLTSAVLSLLAFCNVHCFLQRTHTDTCFAARSKARKLSCNVVKQVN